MLHQVCTCPQSNLTAGDPHCPVHGQPPASVTYSWCESCALKDARIKELEEQSKDWIRWKDIMAKRNAKLEKVVETAGKFTHVCFGEGAGAGPGMMVVNEEYFMALRAALAALREG